MRLVIVTSVVASAAFRDRSPERLITRIVGRDDCEWFASQAIVDEYIEVLSRKKLGLSPAIIDEWRAAFAQEVTLLDVTKPFHFPTDPDDAPFLACALAADADLLVSGDRHLLALGVAGRTRIVTVTEALNLLAQP